MPVLQYIPLMPFWDMLLLIFLYLLRLRNRQKDEWGNCVTVVSSDMRYWTAPEKVNTVLGNR